MPPANGTQASERYRLHWDGTISAGNVLTAVALLASMLIWGLRLEGRVDMQQAVGLLHASRIQHLEQKDQADTREIAAVRESLAELKGQSTAVLRAITRLEAAIDAKSSRP